MKISLKKMNSKKKMEKNVILSPDSSGRRIPFSKKQEILHFVQDDKIGDCIK